MPPAPVLAPDIIEECIGTQGYYQWIIVATVFIARVPLAWHLLCHGIMVPSSTPIYCNNTASKIDAELNSTAIKMLRTEACSKSCPKVIVSTKYYVNSIHKQFDLYCDRLYLTTVSQFLVMLGVFVGNNVFGVIADRCGRKHPFILAMIFQPVFGTIIAFSPNIYVFLVCKFFLNVFVGGGLMTSFVLYSEFIGRKWRPILSTLQTVPFIFGHLMLTGFAYAYKKDWRWFQLTISLPSILGISFYFIVPESARWLIAIGSTEKGIAILEKIAKKNKKPYEHIRPLIEEHQRERGDQTNVRKGSIKDLFASKYMVLITLGMWYSWFAVMCGFYGVAQYAGSLGGNIYIDYALSAVMQLPGVFLLLITLPYLGRKWSIFIGFGVGGVALFSVIFIFAYPQFQIIPVSIAMMTLTMSCQALYVYACEMFPTTIRNIGMGSSSAMGRIGSMASAVFADLKTVSDYIPPVTFSVIMVIAAGLCFIFPETKDKPLPDTVQDVALLWKKAPVAAPVEEPEAK